MLENVTRMINDIRFVHIDVEAEVCSRYSHHSHSHDYLFLENEIEARKYIIFTVSSGINLARTFDSDEISKYLPIAAINRSIV